MNTGVAFSQPFCCRFASPPPHLTLFVGSFNLGSLLFPEAQSDQTVSLPPRPPPHSLCISTQTRMAAFNGCLQLFIFITDRPSRGETWVRVHDSNGLVTGVNLSRWCKLNLRWFILESHSQQSFMLNFI